MSIRAFARYLGVDEKAVRRAIATGRLRKSIGYDYGCKGCGFRWQLIGLGNHPECPFCEGEELNRALEREMAGDPEWE